MIVDSLGLTPHKMDMADWREMVEHMQALDNPLSIALVGKYVDLPDAYISVKEALRHAGLHHNRDVQISWGPVRRHRARRRGASSELG